MLEDVPITNEGFGRGVREELSLLTDVHQLHSCVLHQRFALVFNDERKSDHLLLFQPLSCS